MVVVGAAPAMTPKATSQPKAFGAHVITTASSGKRDLVASLGADEVVGYTTTDLADVVRDIVVVFDTVRGDVRVVWDAVQRHRGRPDPMALRGIVDLVERGEPVRSRDPGDDVPLCRSRRWDSLNQRRRPVRTREQAGALVEVVATRDHATTTARDVWRRWSLGKMESWQHLLRGGICLS